MANSGPVQELEEPLAGRLVFLQHLGAGDVGRHQVGRELDAAEAQAERVGQRADHERLGQAGHADQQAVAAGEDGDQQFLEHPLLADDGLAHLLADAAIAVVEALDGGQVALDARPGLAGDGLPSSARARHRLDDVGGLIAGQPGAAAAQAAAARGHLHEQPTILAPDIWHDGTSE